MRNTARLAAFAALLLLDPCSVRAQQPNPSPILSLGNAVVTAFSGTVAPDPRHVPRTKSAIDLTFIDPDAASARIFDVRTPGFAWDGRNWPAPKTFDVFARDAGQVFGIALDDEASPNIYLTATSAYGLQIVAPGTDGTPQRVTRGQQRAEWMKGQFGPAQGGPGSIWKVDGRTGQVTLFANVTLNGAANWGPGLGNITYDRAHRQLFVSDLATGMIHRFDLAGRELQSYDHGTAARPARSLPPVAFDPGRRVEITDSRFDSENPDSWGFAAPERRIYAVMIRQEGRDTRLYYSVWDGPQIWSVGIQPDGSFGNDPRWELDVAATPRSFPVSDMVFTQQGAMILAQRGGIVSSYDYSVFARPGEARVLRYTLEQPDDPATPSRWIAQPDEHAIGFRGDFRNTDGGVDLGYGWRDGRIDTASCATALWTTGESLRDNPAFSTRLQPGGPFVVSGLQASPVDQVRDQNTPPWTAYFIDYDGRYNDTRASGHIGSVRILRADCGGPIAGPGVPPVPPVGPPPLCPQGLNPDGTCGIVPIDLAIKKTASEGKYDPATGTWTFTFTLSVTNVGNPFIAANHIVINDPAPNGLTFTAAAGTNWTCPPGQFPATAPNALNCTYNFGPGQIATGATLPPLVITVTVKNAGKYENCATTGINGAPWLQETTQRNNRDCAPITVPVDLAIQKTAARSDRPDTYTFTLTVTNVGAAIANPTGMITVTDPIPAGMTVTNAAGAGWACAPAAVTGPGTLTCAFNGSGPIAHNQALPITFTATVTYAGSYENCATVGVTPAMGVPDSNPDNNKGCTKFDVLMDLAITKVATTQTSTGYGFILGVTSVGQPFNATNVVTVTDAVPAGMTFTGATGTNWTCVPLPITGPAPLTCTYSGPPPTAANQSLGTITITANKPPAGTYENCATVGVTPTAGVTDGNAQNNRACAPITIERDYDVSLDKSFVTGASDRGGTYTFKVKNEGGSIVVPGMTIKITDTVPIGVMLTGLAGTAATNWSCTPGFPAIGATTRICTFIGSGTFATGATLPDLVLNATLAAAGSETGIYNNCGTVDLTNASGPVTETNTANNKACTVTKKINITSPCETGNCPQPHAVCKQDVLFVVDSSQSIGGGLATVTQAITQFLQAMKDKGGSANIFTFNNGGIGTSNPSWTSVTGWTLVTSGNAPTLASPITLGGTRTDWDDALKHAAAVAPTAPLAPPLVLFITDGNPTAYMDDTTGLEVDATNLPVTAAQQAVPWINAIRASGSPFIALGFTDAATTGYLDAAVTGNSSGPNDVTLETSSVIKMATVDSLPGVLSTLGNQMCGTLSLNKRNTTGLQIWHQIPKDGTSVAVNDKFGFALDLTNGATTPVSGVEVQDQVPSVLGNVTVVPPSVGTATVAGNLITWSGITVGARQTVTLSFSGVLVKTYTAPTSEGWTNYAQVTAATNYSATKLGNMDPVNGAPTEPDESSANFAEYITKEIVYVDPCKADSKPDSCYLVVSKSPKPRSETNDCKAGNPCPFGVSVDLRSPPIPAGSTVTISDTLTLNGNQVTWPATVPLSFCPLAQPSTVTFSSCNHTPLSYFSGDIVVQIPPGQTGNLENCITVTVTNATTNPPLNVSQRKCAQIPNVPLRVRPVVCPPGNQLVDSACVPIVRPLVCDPATTIKRGNICVCRIPGMVKSSETACACPTGMNFVPGRGCVPPLKCDPPKIPNPTNTACICPEGTLLRGRECVKQTVCQPPMIPAPGAGRNNRVDGAQSCVCPPGTVQKEGECVKQPICQPPMIPAPGGARPGAPSCVCPQGTVQQGQNCVKQTVCQPPMIPAPGTGPNLVAGAQRCVCPPPMIPGPAGGRASGAQTCVCPQGTVQRGRECVKQIVCPPPMILGPAPGAGYTGVAGAQTCVCPPGTVQKGRDCVRPGPTRPPGGPATPGAAQPNEPARTPAR